MILCVPQLAVRHDASDSCSNGGDEILKIIINKNNNYKIVELKNKIQITCRLINYMRTNANLVAEDCLVSPAR